MSSTQHDLRNSVIELKTQASFRYEMSVYWGEPAIAVAVR